ncbi:hypothetical protein UFOVP204_67 [uncultured Caudovirales phage]|uniref:Helix-turn-helix domain-containing protein n=1 Tax=uncultured Caudovirales phage TaxID=2100421 RepID=A0A6J7WNG1_9CAUD|nr:hypothetical protein UFOVP204_67 [uncultured Caudovirales phage]
MAKSTKLWDNKDWVFKRYVTEKKSVLDMAMEARCSHMTIQRALERFDLIKKPRKWVKK